LLYEKKVFPWILLALLWLFLLTYCSFAQTKTISGESDWFVKNTNFQLGLIEEIAAEKDKLFALSETGYETIPYAAWWTETLLKAIGQHRISYVLVWRNHGYNEFMKKMHYYAPYKGHASETDFVKFYQLDNTLFEKEVAKEKLYND